MRFSDFMRSLNEATKEDFWRLADLQRDAPEHAMLAVQMAMSGGVLNPIVEHIGDLIHRMTEKPSFYQAGFEFVKQKVEKCLRILTNGYGFEREFEENIQNNSRYMKTTPDELRKKVYAALEVYAQEHEKLPTYNRAQQAAKLAAVAVGRRKWQTAVGALKILELHLNSREEWMKFAHESLESGLDKSVKV